MNGMIRGGNESFCIWCKGYTMTAGKRMREMLEVGELLRVTCERREMRTKKEGHHGSQRSALGRSRGPFRSGASEESATHHITVKGGH